MIIQCIPNSKEVILYNDKINSIIRKTVDFPALIGTSNFLEKSAFININGKLYISGGNLRGKPSDLFLVYDANTNGLTKLADLLTARQSHSILHHQDMIYVIGGNNNTCEKYDMKTMKWSKMPSLISDDRKNSILYVHGNFLYAFFGIVKGEYSDTIERINIKNVRSKWEIVPYQKQKDMNLKFIGGGIIEENDREIYIFGGKSDEGLRKKAIKFNFSNLTFSSTEIVLDEGTFFQESLLIKLDESSYGLFNSDKNENFLKIQLGP